MEGSSTIPFSKKKKNERIGAIESSPIRKTSTQLPRFNIYEINILLGRRVFVLTIDSRSALKIVPPCITDYAY